MSKPLACYTTADGSPTLYLAPLDQHYHSIHGAQQESEHVFLRTGLRSLPAQSRIDLLEVGFGTGLNALLTAQYALRQKQVIHYTALEKYPLTPATWEALSYPQAAPAAWLPALHQAPWSENYALQPFFQLQKQDGDLRTTPFAPALFDLIYFDAFAPEAQPELWTEEIFSALYASLRPGGVLVTYCVKGRVRRALKAAGFAVEKKPGPPGKREITRAEKPRH